MVSARGIARAEIRIFAEFTLRAGLCGVRGGGGEGVTALGQIIYWVFFVFDRKKRRICTQEFYLQMKKNLFGKKYPKLIFCNKCDGKE